MFLFRCALRLGATEPDIILISGDIGQSVDKSLAGVVGHFVDAPTIRGALAECETGVTEFIIFVIFGQIRRFGQVGGGFP